MRVDELARLINAEVVGDGSIEVNSAATLDDAQPGQVSFLSNPRYRSRLATTRASAVIVARGVTSERLTLLRTADPYYAFAQAVVALHGYRKHPHEGIHPAAQIDPTASVGAGTVVYPGVYVGPRAKIGRDCILYPNVVIYDDCVLGDRVTIHSGTVVGQDGYGYATHQGRHHKIPQVGNVVIEDDVEIGSNCVIERAAMGSTVIGRGTKIDSLVAIGHGTKIGADCLLVSQVGIAGSVTVGHHVAIGGQVGVAGHLKIGDNVMIAAKSGVMNDVPSGSVLMGSPAIPAGQFKRIWAVCRQLPQIIQRLKQLEKRQDDQVSGG